MAQTLKSTSLANDEKNIVCIKGQPFNTARAPFDFNEEDLVTGELTPYDITSLSFELFVYENFGELVYQSTDLAINAPNQLYLNLPAITIDTGVYNYEILIIGGQSVVNGSFKVVKNAKPS
jgi:hypothetical protein